MGGGHSSAGAPPAPATSIAASIEELLIRQGAVDEAHLARARRVQARLAKSQPLGEILVELGQLPRAEYDRIIRLHRSGMSVPEILFEDGLLDAAGLALLEEARARMPQASDRSLLVDEVGLVSEEHYLRALAVKVDIPYVEPEVGLVDPAVLKKASIPYLLRHKVLPLRIVDGTLSAVLADPLDTRLLGEIKRMFGVPVKPSCGTSGRIAETLQTLERLRLGPGTGKTTSLQYREIQAAERGDEKGEGAVQIVDYLILRAIELGASDLHIEPMQNKIRVRVRVDGVMRPLTDLPTDFAARVAARVKILASADIAERRLHQDGRLLVKAEQREVDIRVSTYASMYGETLVLRLLDRGRGLVPLQNIGFEPSVLSLVRDTVLRTSSGLVLVTGPTGSGKTTTLYSFVDYVNDASLKTITAEDPVEYVMDGITQCSVNEKTGPTFADSLRAIVRQDPDIIVVGEIRDRTTAGLAVECALTGHKVLSTLHTEDAVGAIVRLIDMGLEHFYVASTLSCVVAQRLVRRVCTACRQPAEPDRGDLRYLNLDRAQLAGATLVAGTGCPSCRTTGYKGRAGIHEVLVPDDTFRDAIMRHATTSELRELARRLPTFLTLQEDGVLKAMAGVTTLAEIADNAPRDDAARAPQVLRERIGQGGLR